ncbi:uncharacterized protein I303_101722 [Kwoniella dejecticola CBS 10117]|uniref:Cohesin complex subunit SCC1 n=1 Tax=Kwoniella dejecticola CBS 10117 TaxID=1296121 RepID=A0A1A6ACY1_9TREE|nr:uncharacterized protein I303_02142 [Kwoniella dejecticola CBS 10117]OBR87927.1 hypothetical protein I303_02142 [Kwoniella dejecticola CBS 10117]
MLLNELVKSGPLAKIWLSAHQEKKLTKQQALNVDVGESVDAILTQDAAQPLRSSGPLMLGVVRIYSRKVGYLFDDCKEARERISLAFRPGIVDLPEDQIRASKNAITFPDVRNDFDFLDWTWSGPSFQAPEVPLVQAPINLPRTREFGAYNFGRPAAPSIYGGSTAASRSSLDLDGSGLDTNDFSGIDLGLNFEGDITMDVEQGRDLMTPISRYSREGSAAARAKGRTSVGLGSVTGDMGIEPLDLGLDFDNLDQPLPELETRSRRETSALSTPPPLSPPAGADLTLDAETAAQIAAAPQAVPKLKRPRLVQADAELELPDEPRDLSAILGEERYIPSDPEAIRLQEIMADPSAHFLPIIKVGGENMIYAGPQGLAPELAELFTFPSNVLRRSRVPEEEDRASKRPRLEEDEDVEAGRRIERGSEPFEFPSGFGQDIGMGGDDTFALQPEDEPLITPRATRVLPREPSIAPSRAESIAREIQFGEGQGEFALSIFDSRTAAGREEFSQSQSQPSQQSTPTKASERTTTTGGFSKNTSMAMGLLRKELDAIEEEDRVVSFEKLADQSTKRAASSFFFELLVLGTRDCVKLEQKAPYQDIEIRGKDKLWPEEEGLGLGGGAAVTA